MGYCLLGIKMTLNIIFDDRRPEKWEPLMQELSRQGITDYKIWPPVEDVNNVIRSINLSHKQIVQDAKDRGLKETAIAEDDVFFPSPDGWQYFLRKKPPYYELYLGGCYSPVRVFMDVPTNTFEYIVRNPVGLHLYMIHEGYYDTFLSTNEIKHIDTSQEGIFHICYPMAALQRPGFSANNRSHADYNTILKPEDIYQ